MSSIAQQIDICSSTKIKGNRPWWLQPSAHPTLLSWSSPVVLMGTTPLCLSVCLYLSLVWYVIYVTCGERDCGSRRCYPSWPYYTEKGSLTELHTPHSRLDGQQAPRIYLSLPPNVGVTGTYRYAQLFSFFNGC